MIDFLIRTHGFEKWHTGGGCVALGRSGDGFYLIITAEDGISYPTADDWMIGFEDDQESALIRVGDGLDISEAIETLTN